MDVFAVIADPTRRAMLEMMLNGERPAGEFVAAFPKVSQPAISQHLKVLRDCGMVSVRAEKQRRLYSLERTGLDDVREWLKAFVLSETPDVPQPVAEVADAPKPARKKNSSKPKPEPMHHPPASAEPLMLDLFG